MTPARKKWLLGSIKLIIVLLVLGFAGYTLLGARTRLTNSTWQWRLSPGWLVLSGLLYLLGMLFAGLFWFRVLRDLGQEPHLGETLRAYFIGHLGKYVPGKAMVIIIRAGLLSGPRVDPAAAAAAVFVETMTMMAVGTALGAGIVAWLLIGLSLWAALRGIGLEGLEPLGLLPQYTCCVSLATVAGILSMIPGGFGARDAALFQLIHTLLPQVHAGPALVASVMLRIIVLASEAICAGIIYPMTFLAARRLAPAENDLPT